MANCPVCNVPSIFHEGKSGSPYLLVLSKPYEQQSNGWRGKQLTGIDVLQKEFFRVGIDLNDFKIAYLNIHDGADELCYQAGRNSVLENAKGKKAVVLVGTEVSQEFCGKSSDDVAGLQVDSVSLSAPLVFVLPKPESVFVKGSGVGELRLACQKLSRRLE